MASWDDDNFDADKDNIKFSPEDKWEGEDEDDDIMDNWDDEEEEDKKDGSNIPSSQPKKKKPLAERIKEKEEKRRLEKLAKEEERKSREEENRKLSPEELMVEKLKNQKLQEEADLELAKEAFGVTETIPGQKTIDTFNPASKEEFTELSNMISQKLLKYEEKSEYSNFLESLFRDCCTGLESEDIKKISNTLNILANEKQKINKAKVGKKKGAKNKNTISQGKGVSKTEMDYTDNFYDEYEDFI